MEEVVLLISFSLPNARHQQYSKIFKFQIKRKCPILSKKNVFICKLQLITRANCTIFNRNKKLVNTFVEFNVF